MSKRDDGPEAGRRVSALEQAEQPPVSTSEERARLQRQARALGNPTRFALFEDVARLHRPVQVATLVERFRLNHNVIRQHLAKLCEAGLFVEEFAPRSGPGRPALQYRLAPDVSSIWGISSPYEQLATLLLDMTVESVEPREVGRRAGGRAAATADGEQATPLEKLVAEMRRTGLEPRTLHRSTGVDLVLGACPLVRGVGRHRDIVCEIHRGLAEGFLEELASELNVTELHQGQSGDGPCTIRLESTRTI